MLMRRLLDRVGRAPSEVRFIGTSATLGSGERSYPEVATFASHLFGGDFQYVPWGNPSRQDVLGAERLALVMPEPDDTITLEDALAEHDATTRSEKLLAIPGAQALLQGIADRPRRAEMLARRPAGWMPFADGPPWSMPSRPTAGRPRITHPLRPLPHLS